MRTGRAETSGDAMAFRDARRHRAWPELRQVARKMIRCLDVTETYTWRASKSTESRESLGSATTVVDTSRNGRRRGQREQSLPADEGVSTRSSEEETWHWGQVYSLRLNKRWRAKALYYSDIRGSETEAHRREYNGPAWSVGK